jgi:TorA maturation chaperone TorD
LKELRDQKFKKLSLLFSYPDTIPDMEKCKFVFRKKPPPIPSLVEIQNKYIQLFINALPEVPCPPYGSIYLEGACMGKTTIAVWNLYKKYGFETDEIPDHIAVELEFLHYLQQLSYYEKKVTTDFVFLLNHLRSWTPAFFERIEKHDKNGFYKIIAQIAKIVLFDSKIG